MGKQCCAGHPGRKIDTRDDHSCSQYSGWIGQSQFHFLMPIETSFSIQVIELALKNRLEISVRSLWDISTDSKL
jgi:hypothetical protein